MRLVSASICRWALALLPGWIARASRSAPTSRSGQRRSWWWHPLIVTFPAVGASRPMMSRIVGDFPDPLGPGNPVTAPARTAKLRLSAANVSP
jgi:hypothetical protein